MKQIHGFTTAQIVDIININCVSMAAMTAALVPLLDKKASAIINLSSFLGENAVPSLSLYSSSKAFNTLFSESISLEN